jgi:hypothetical protein
MRLTPGQFKESGSVFTSEQKPRHPRALVGHHSPDRGFYL